ncbi:hypothetical protein [Mycobacteroides chelonae]|uniref:hypothetical protein n=1 Tax=Mycobacteroides chelonae TaxID=1774 RepID=UPI0008A90059|nr:hypothetical protein [Mycobacteroides chelonae]OHU64011.1 hypothetical protein BKG85_11295 [Mycobacteroides chelonae]
MSLGEHHFLLNGARHKAEELLQAYGELYDLAFPITAKPRELQSLDCEEARDGTVWVDSDPHMPWSYRFNGEWAYARGHANSWSHWKPLTVRGLLTSSRLYTEVVE